MGKDGAVNAAHQVFKEAYKPEFMRAYRLDLRFVPLFRIQSYLQKAASRGTIADATRENEKKAHKAFL